MKKILSTIFIAALLGVVGCDSSSTPAVPPASPPPPPPPSAAVQVLNASADSPSLSVSFDTFMPPAGSPLLAVDFKNGVAGFTVDIAAHTVQATVNTADGTAPVAFAATNFTAVDGMQYAIVAIGDFGAQSAVILEQSDTVTAGMARARIMHAAPAAGMVDVFVTAPAADLTLEVPLGTLDFGQDLAPVEVAAGDYQVRVTSVGDPADVVFDSGTLTLADGDDLLAVAVTNTTTGNSPITLVASDGSSFADGVDINATADIQFAHASPDAGLIDVIADSVELLGDVAYGTASGFLPQVAGTYDTMITVADDPTTVHLQQDVTGTAGVRNTVVVYDLLATIAAVELNDDDRRVVTDAKLRLVHGSPAAGAVDIYITAPGTDITTTTPTLTNVALGTNSGFMTMEPGMYDVSFTATGMTDVALLLAVTLAADGIYTAVAIDADGGGAPVGSILLDDLAP